MKLGNFESNITAKKQPEGNLTLIETMHLGEKKLFDSYLANFDQQRDNK